MMTRSKHKALSLRSTQSGTTGANSQDLGGGKQCKPRRKPDQCLDGEEVPVDETVPIPHLYKDYVQEKLSGDTYYRTSGVFVGMFNDDGPTYMGSAIAPMYVSKSPSS